MIIDTFTDDRYSRQRLCVRGFSQERLANASVLILGVGGLGGTVAMQLAMAGVGRLHLCDADSVAASNLNRQILFKETDIGRPKLEVARRRLNAINAECYITTHPFFFSVETSFDIPKPSVIVDCLDSFSPRIAAVQYAKSLGVPLVHAGVQAFEGQIFIYEAVAETSCPFCSFNMTREEYNRCMLNEDKIAPSLGACVNAFASIQAAEVIKIICNIGTLAYGRFYCFDLLEHQYSFFTATYNQECLACSQIALAKNSE